MEELKEGGQQSVESLLTGLRMEIADSKQEKAASVSQNERQVALMKALFKYRREILEHLGELWDDEETAAPIKRIDCQTKLVITTKDIIDLIIYSQEDYGSVDLPQTRILFKIMDRFKGNDMRVCNFLLQIKSM
jgi:hypothetical protein